MPIGVLWWVLFVLWIVFNGVWWRNGVGWAYGWSGNGLLLVFLLFLIGWHDFGFIIR